MVISRWKKDSEEVEVHEMPADCFVAWNVTTGAYAVENETGRCYFDTAAEVEDSLLEDGWVKR